MRNSYTFPADEWDANDSFGREPSVPLRRHYSKPSRNPGDLVAIMDKIIDRLPEPKKGIWK